MLKDEELLPICKRLAARFMKDARLLSGPADTYDELVNVAYVSAKELKSLAIAPTWITWKLIHYISTPESSARRKDKARGDLIDRRKRSSSSCSTEPNPIELMIEKEETAKLIHAVSQLTPLEARIIYRRFRDGSSYKQIGLFLGYSEEWARQQVLAILKKLRRLMK